LGNLLLNVTNRLSEAEMRADTSIRPVLLAALGIALFAGLDAMMKVIAGAYPLAQATGMRYGAGAVTATIFYISAGGKWPSRDQILRSLPRTFANLAAGTCFFFAISRLPLVDAVAITFLSPLFLSLWGLILLGEPLKKATLAAILIGLAGVFVIARGQSLNAQHSFDVLGFLAAIGCAALYALSMVMTRSQSSRDALPTLVLLPSLGGALFSAAPMIWVWQPVPLWHFGLLAGVGAIGTGAYVCLAWAYTRSHVGRLGLMEYTGLLWAAVFGYCVFHEVPSAWTIAGAVLIVSACLPAFRKTAPTN
jgi:drug/metabolite transporter (DMT)-like permease